MRKIRKFKIELRVRELARRAKKSKIDLVQAGLADDAALEKFGAELQRSLEPAVVYQSFPPDHAQAALAPVTGLGFSLGVATLGNGPLAFERSLLEGRRESLASLCRLAVELALEDAVGFVLALVKQEAEEEECDLSPIGYLRDASAVQSAAASLQAERIGVAPVEGRLEPACSAAFGVSWIARPRSKKAARR